MIPDNWRGEKNPFALAGPPPWWRVQLHDIDPKLQLFASIVHPIYLLARRSPRAAHFRFLTRAATGAPAEAQRLMAAGCVFVKTIDSLGVTNDYVLNWLRNHDSWKPTAPTVDASIEKFITLTDDADAARLAKRDAAADDELLQRGSSAYTALLLRRKQMAFVHQPDAQLSRPRALR